MCHIYELYFYARRLFIFGELHSVINFIKVFIDCQGQVNRLIRYLIVRFDIGSFIFPY